METIRVVFRHPQGKAPLTLELPRDTRFSALTPLLYENRAGAASIRSTCAA